MVENERILCQLKFNAGLKKPLLSTGYPGRKIVMPDGYQVWSEQLREVISDKLGWFTYYWSRQSFYFVAFSWLVPLGKSNWGTQFGA